MEKLISIDEAYLNPTIYEPKEVKKVLNALHYSIGPVVQANGWRTNGEIRYNIESGDWVGIKTKDKGNLNSLVKRSFKGIKLSDDQAQEWIEGILNQNKISESHSEYQGPINLINLDEIEPKPVEWLWPGRIPKGKLTIIAGEPDVGKSFLTMFLAASVSTGTDWPDGSKNQLGNVLLFSSEDDPNDTIVPRLRSNGANLTRIKAFRSIHKKQGNQYVEGDISIIADFAELKRLVSVFQPKLIIIDPIDAYLSGIDTYRNADMRANVFSPLKRLAEEFGTTIICIMHLNKTNSTVSKNRVNGSIAYVAAVRAAWLISADKNEPERKIMAPIKFNLGPRPTGLAYRITSDENEYPVLNWEKDPIKVSADNLLVTEDIPFSELEVAMQFLKEVLSNGPVPVNDIQKLAKEEDIAWRTIRRAKNAIRRKN